MAEDTLKMNAPGTTSPPLPARPVAQNEPAKSRSADIAELGKLQAEYLDLKEKTGKGPAPSVDSQHARDMARKLEVTKAMDTIKRKHGLP